jgi:hypothetical protein
LSIPFSSATGSFDLSELATPHVKLIDTLDKTVLTADAGPATHFIMGELRLHVPNDSQFFSARS